MKTHLHYIYRRYCPSDEAHEAEAVHRDGTARRALSSATALPLGCALTASATGRRLAAVGACGAWGQQGLSCSRARGGGHRACAHPSDSLGRVYAGLRRITGSKAPAFPGNATVTEERKERTVADTSASAGKAYPRHPTQGSGTGRQRRPEGRRQAGGPSS